MNLQKKLVLNGKHRHQRRIAHKQQTIDEQGYLYSDQAGGRVEILPGGPKPRPHHRCRRRRPGRSSKTKKPAAKGALDDIMLFFFSK